jgi:spermidine/putrescine transport system substrate-binding protein
MYKNNRGLSRRNLILGSSAFAAGLTLSPYSINAYSSEEENKLNFYNWDTYIGEDTLRNFKSETGVVTKIDFFADNDELFAKLREGNPGYDVIVPSNNFVEKMIEANMLSPLDHSKIKNISNIEKRFLDASFDKNRKYSLPYMWGTMGIGYATDKVKEIPNSWSFIYESDKYSGKIAMLSEAADVIGMGLKYLGHSINSMNPSHYKEVEDLIISQKKHIKVFAEDNGQDLLASRDIYLAQEWNGDIGQVMLEDNNIDYLIPKEGSLIWEDCLCIPNGAPHPNNAHKLIDYIYDANVGADIADYIQYATPNKAARNLLGDDYNNNTSIFPEESVLEKCESQLYLGEDILKIIEDSWTRIRAA